MRRFPFVFHREKLRKTFSVNVTKLINRRALFLRESFLAPNVCLSFLLPFYVEDHVEPGLEDSD